MGARGRQRTCQSAHAQACCWRYIARLVNRSKSSVRSHVEHVFAVGKRLQGFSKAGSRGLVKNATRAFVAPRVSPHRPCAGLPPWMSASARRVAVMAAAPAINANGPEHGRMQAPIPPCENSQACLTEFSGLLFSVSLASGLAVKVSEIVDHLRSLRALAESTLFLEIDRRHHMDEPMNRWSA